MHNIRIHLKIRWCNYCMTHSKDKLHLTPRKIFKKKCHWKARRGLLQIWYKQLFFQVLLQLLHWTWLTAVRVILNQKRENGVESIR